MSRRVTQGTRTTAPECAHFPRFASQCKQAVAAFLLQPHPPQSKVCTRPAQACGSSPNPLHRAKRALLLHSVPPGNGSQQLLCLVCQLSTRQVRCEWHRYPLCLLPSGAVCRLAWTGSVRDDPGRALFRGMCRYTIPVY